MLRISDERNTSMNFLLIFCCFEYYWSVSRAATKRCSVSREHKLPAQSYSGFYNCMLWKVSTTPPKNDTLLKAEWNKCWSEYLSLKTHVKVEIVEDMTVLSAGGLIWACFTLEPTFVRQNYWAWTTKSSCAVCEKAGKVWKVEWGNCRVSFKPFSL